MSEELPGATKAPTRVAALDGIRVLAIAAVFAYHANATWLPGGFLGVTVFFVLAGYLTTLSIERELRREGSFNYLRYVGKRVARLWPSCAIVVGGALLLSALFANPVLSKAAADAPWAMLFLDNIHYLVAQVSYFAASGAPSPLTHLWYLGVLMQLSLAWPLVLMLLRRVFRRRNHAAAAVAALAVASAVLMALLYDPMQDTARIYYGPDTRAAEYLLGCVAALLTGGHGWRWRVLGERLPWFAYDVVALLCSGVIVYLCFALDGYNALAYRGGIFLSAALSAVLVGCLSRGDSALSSVLGARPLAALGARSFQIYLWHYPLLVVMNPPTRTTELPWWGWLLEVVVILAVAELFYHLAEKSPEKSVELKGHSAARKHLVAAIDVVCVLICAYFVLLPPQGNDAVGPEGQTREQLDAASAGIGFDVAGGRVLQRAAEQALSIGRGGIHDFQMEAGISPESVILIGDSVPAGAVSQFYETFPNGYIDAEVGRQIYYGVDALNAAFAAGYDADNIVWSLGNNGVASEEQVQQLIDASGNRKVYLVTARVPLPLQDMNNALFADLAARYDNVYVVDWYAASAGNDDYFWSDGTHLTPEGAAAYVRMLRQAISGW